MFRKIRLSGHCNVHHPSPGNVKRHIHYVFQRFNTPHIKGWWENPEAWKTQKNCINWSNWCRFSVQLLRRQICWLIFTVWLDRKLLWLATSPHQNFISISTSNLLLARGHFSILFCNRSIIRDQNRDWGCLKILNLYLFLKQKQLETHQSVSPWWQQCPECPIGSHRTSLLPWSSW